MTYSGGLLGEWDALRRGVREALHLSARAIASAERELVVQEFEQALDVLILALRAEARLSAVGFWATAYELFNYLSSYIHTHIATDIEHSNVPRVIVIAGPPRTGTTYLHRLLASLQGYAAPTLMDLRSTLAFGRAGPVSRAVIRAQVGAVRTLGKRVDQLHPIHAGLAEECTFALQHSLRSPGFAMLYRAPSYVEWLSHGHLLEGYKYLSRFYRALNGKRRDSTWVLKSPAHIFGLAELLQFFPDAKVIVTRREIVSSTVSTLELAEALRRTFSKDVDPTELAEELIPRLYDGHRALSYTLAKLPPSQKCILDYDELAREPLCAIDRLAAELELDLTELQRASLPVANGALPHRPRTTRKSAEYYGTSADQIARWFEGSEFRG